MGSFARPTNIGFTEPEILRDIVVSGVACVEDEEGLVRVKLYVEQSTRIDEPEPGRERVVNLSLVMTSRSYGRLLCHLQRCRPEATRLS